MGKKDYYELLGIKRDAGLDEIKKAYRSMAAKYHPDKNPKNKEQAEEKFKEILEAYEILKDPNKKEAYDRYGHDAFNGGSAGGGGYGFSGFEGFSSTGADFSDIFNDLFGGGFSSGKRSTRSKRSASSGGYCGSNLRYDLEITLEDAFHGKEVPIRYTTQVKCSGCNGTGSEGATGATKFVQCSTCHGSGIIRNQQGCFIVERPCHICNGEGEVIQNKCKKCTGSGRVREEVNLYVTIPKGVENCEEVKIENKGEAGYRGGKSGDLYVYFRVKNHRFFTRSGSNLYCKVPVKMVVAALGGEIEAPSIDGNFVKVKVPEGSQSGTKLRLKDKGMPLRGSPNKRGDMYIQIVVETPVNLNKKQVELLKKFDEDSNNECNPETNCFFKKVKSFWDEVRPK